MVGTGDLSRVLVISSMDFIEPPGVSISMTSACAFSRAVRSSARRRYRAIAGPMTPSSCTTFTGAVPAADSRGVTIARSTSALASHQRILDSFNGTVARLPHRVANRAPLSFGGVNAREPFALPPASRRRLRRVPKPRARSPTGGRIGAPSCDASTISAIERAAAVNIPSLISRARVTIVPNARPGKSIALFACAIV